MIKKTILGICALAFVSIACGGKGGEAKSANDGKSDTSASSNGGSGSSGGSGGGSTTTTSGSIPAGSLQEKEFIAHLDEEVQGYVKSTNDTCGTKMSGG
jgi:hypothetical protein